MSQRTAYFLPQGQRGGWGIKKREGGTSPHSSKSFVFRGLPLLFGFHDDDTEKSGETIATPPETGVPTGPDSGTVGHASIRPQGVAIVGIYPCGKARKQTPPDRGEIKRRMDLWNCGRTGRTLTTALSRLWYRAGWADELEKPRPSLVVAYIGWEIFNVVASRSCWVNGSGTASAPGRFVVQAIPAHC